MNAEIPNKGLNVSGLAGLLVGLLCIVYPLGNLTRYLFFYVLVAASAAILVGYLLRSRALLSRSSLPRISGGLPVFLFFGLMVLSTLWAFYPFRTLQTSATTLVFLWIFVLALVASGAGNRSWLHCTVTFVPYVCGALFLYTFYKYGSIRVTSTQMKEEIGSIANIYPAIVLLCLPFLIYLCVRVSGGRVSRLLAGGGFVATIVVVSLSGSRGALVMLALIVFLVPLLFGGTLRSRVVFLVKLGAITLVTLVGVSSIFGFTDTLGTSLARFTNSSLFAITESASNYDPSAVASDERFDPFSDSGSTYSTAEARRAEETAPFEVPLGPDRRRTLMYLEGARLISSYPILGIGYNGLYLYMQNKYEFTVSSHNIVITAWGELGIAGMALILWIAGAALWALVRARKSANGDEFLFYSATLVALLVAAVHAQLRPQLTNPMVYVVLGIALSMSFYPLLGKVSRGLYGRLTSTIASKRPR